MYTGDGATAANNAAWPGVEMTAPSATDGCQQTDLYKYVVPDNLAKGAKVIFNDGGSQQYPGIPPAGPRLRLAVPCSWDGSSAALAAVECETTSPGVTSVSVSGDGVKDGKLSLKSGRERAADRDGQARQRDGPQGHLDELGQLERRERDGHRRGHRRLGRPARPRSPRLGGRQERVRAGVRHRPEAQDPWTSTLDASGEGPDGRRDPGRGGAYVVSGQRVKAAMLLDVAGGSPRAAAPTPC